MRLDPSADHLAEFCEFSRERIRVIAGAINVTEFSTRAQPEATQSSADGPRILSVGRLEARKGTDTLIRAMSRVWHTFPDARLCLPGRGQFTPGELLALAPAAKRAQILFPGYVAHAQLSAYYQSASLYVTATRYETFAYTVLEAMASSLPVIASRTGAIPELIEDGQNGVLSPVDDPRALGETMTGLLSDRARMARLGVAARESAQQFAPARVGPQHEAFYASAVEAHAHRAR